MNILVIGNGFDLAHNRLTKYQNFLDFLFVYQDYDNYDKPDIAQHGWSDDSKSRFEKECWDFILDLQKKDYRLYQKISDLIRENAWIKYFNCLSAGNNPGEGWIDFELEISRVVQAFDRLICILKTQENKGNDYVKAEPQLKCLLKILKPIIRDAVNDIETRVENNIKGITGLYDEDISEDLQDLRKEKQKLLTDLNRLTWCLEIYLSYFLEKVSSESKKVPDIINLPNIDKVLSFNYTDTYEKLYLSDRTVQFDYIHGKIRKCGDLINGAGNLVLGIDEYLKGKDKNVNIEFIEFKKYYQRILNETGNTYREWLDQIREQGESITDHDKPVEHQVFFFGHSLDITDKDIIRDIILTEQVKTTIYYTDKDDLGKKIVNLVKLIGKNKLIEKTGGKKRTIILKKITAE